MSWKRNALESIVFGFNIIAPRCRKFPNEPRSIFILRNNDLGDLLVITPLFEALRRHFPNTRIVAGVGEWAAPILEQNPYVDEIRIINAPWHNHFVNKQKPFAIFQSILFILRYNELVKHDIGIDILGSAWGSLLLMRMGIPFRLGVCGYAGGHTGAQRVVKFDTNQHVGRSALRFAELLGATDLPENRPQLFIDKPPPTGEIIFAPGGGYEEKCWPVDSFVELAKRLSDYRIIVIGGSKDRAAGRSIANAGHHVCDRTGDLSLRESFGLIAGARLVISNSSVAMHAAAAFRKPCVVVLGQDLTNPEQHAAQWAYPETMVIGRQRNENVPSIDRVLQILKRYF